MQCERIGTFFVQTRIPVSRYLQSFYQVKFNKKTGNSLRGKVKFEYVRIRLFRSLKRSLRQYLKKGSFGLGGVASYSTHNCGLLIEKIKDLCRTRRDLMTHFADTKTGPQIDSLPRENKINQFKTYNSKYLASIFENADLRELYKLYVELAFEEKDLGNLCRNWKMRCCDGAHSSECEQHWKSFQALLLQEAEIHVNDTSVFTQVEQRVFREREELVAVCS